jgi:cytochrome c
MDSFELNKILGGVLGTCLLLVGVNIVAGAVFSPEKVAKAGYEIAVQEASTSGATTAPPPEPPIETLFATADVARGEATTKQCQACHTFEKGGPNHTGPNLWGIVGRPRASEPNFNYSAAMKAKGGTWTYDELNKFLTAPRNYIPGTAMTFGGLPREATRADVIDYLNTLSDNPKPLPTKAAENAAPASSTTGTQGAASKPH